MKTPCFILIIVLAFLGGCSTTPLVVKPNAISVMIIAENPMRSVREDKPAPGGGITMYRSGRWFLANGTDGELRVIPEIEVVTLARRSGLTPILVQGGANETFKHLAFEKEDIPKLCAAASENGIQLLIIIRDVSVTSYQVNVDEVKKLPLGFTLSTKGPETRIKESFDLAVYSCSNMSLLFQDTIAASRGVSLWDGSSGIGNAIVARLKSEISRDTLPAHDNSSSYVGIRAQLYIRYPRVTSGTTARSFFPTLERVSREQDFVKLQFQVINPFDETLRIDFRDNYRGIRPICRDQNGAEYLMTSQEGKSSQLEIRPNTQARFTWVFRIADRSVNVLNLVTPVSVRLGSDGENDTVLKFENIPVK